MRSLFQVVVLACCLFGAIPVGSIPTKDCAYKLKEEISPPRGWVKHGNAPANRKIALKFALPQSKFSELEKHLYEVSDPNHARYGQHLSKEEVEELVSPHPESLNTVNDWLASLGFTDEDIVRSPAKDWITIKVPISRAEQMLNTVRLPPLSSAHYSTNFFMEQKYHVWKHVESGDYIVRTTSYSLPGNLHDHIELVQPTTMFGRFKPEKSNIFKATPIPEDFDTAAKSEGVVKAASGVTVDASCNQIITITCLQQLYNAVGFTPSAKGNSIGITGYLVSPCI
jgi:tripeptidyl-peptidase-1